MPEQTVMEVYLSEESAQKRNKELNKMVETDAIPQESPFKEKITSYEEKLHEVWNEHQAFSFMGNRNLLPEKVVITESDFIVKEKKLKSKCLDLLCEASPEEYNLWVFYTLERLFGYCEAAKEGTIDLEYIHFRLELVQKSREAREKTQKESEN